MITHFRTLRPDETLAQAVEHVAAGFQQDFPVVEDGHLVGVLTRHDLTTAWGNSVLSPVSGRSCDETSSRSTRMRCCRPPSRDYATAIVTLCPSCKTARSWGL